MLVGNFTAGLVGPCSSDVADVANVADEVDHFIYCG